MFHLFFPLHYQANRHTLHAAGTQGGLDFAPQNRTDFVTHYAVQHTACLLGIHQVHVDIARILDGVEYRLLGNLVEYDSLCVFRIQFQCLLQMPCYGFPFAVFIGCQPYLVGLLHCFLQVGNQFVLLLGDVVFGLVLIIDVNTHLFLGQIADMAVARFHYIIFTEKLLDGLRFGWRLYDY